MLKWPDLRDWGFCLKLVVRPAADLFCQTGWKKRQGKISLLSLRSGLYPSLPDGEVNV